MWLCGNGFGRRRSSRDFSLLNNLVNLLNSLNSDLCLLKLLKYFPIIINKEYYKTDLMLTKIHLFLSYNSANERGKDGKKWKPRGKRKEREEEEELNMITGLVTGKGVISNVHC